MSRIALVVPDAGPLISLARANALDLLLTLQVPVYLIDQVYYEVTQPKFPDVGTIDAFVQTHPHAVKIYKTFVGRQARLARDAGHVGRQTGLGEAALAEFLNTYELEFEDLSPLLIFEDSDISKSKFIIPDSVHVISTRTFLRGLELAGIISSMEEIWTTIEASGRKPSKAEIDKAGIDGQGHSTWKPKR